MSGLGFRVEGLGVWYSKVSSKETAVFIAVWIASCSCCSVLCACFRSGSCKKSLCSPLCGQPPLRYVPLARVYICTCSCRCVHSGSRVQRGLRERVIDMIQRHQASFPHVRVQGSGFKVEDLGFWVQGLRIQGSGFRVQGSGFRV